MSDFKDKIQQRIDRIDSLKPREVIADTEESLARKAQQEEARIAREAERLAIEARARALGGEVVELLLEHDIPQKAVWELQKVGQETRTGGGPFGTWRQQIDIKRYVHIGTGWHVHTVSTEGEYSDGRAFTKETHTGIHSDGRVFNFDRFKGLSGIPVYESQESLGPARGMVDAYFSSPSVMIREIESDAFQRGIISLITSSRRRRRS